MRSKSGRIRIKMTEKVAILMNSNRNKLITRLDKRKKYSFKTYFKNPYESMKYFDNFRLSEYELKEMLHKDFQKFRIYTKLKVDETDERLIYITIIISGG